MEFYLKSQVKKKEIFKRFFQKSPKLLILASQINLVMLLKNTFVTENTLGRTSGS